MKIHETRFYPASGPIAREWPRTTVFYTSRATGRRFVHGFPEGADFAALLVDAGMLPARVDIQDVYPATPEDGERFVTAWIAATLTQ